MLAATALFWLRFDAEPPRRGQLFPADLFDYYLPRSEGVAHRLVSFELPLWNERLCAGLPELATAQGAALSPVTWLFAPLPTAAALPARIFFECALGGAFAVLWLRRLGLDAIPAALGGALYAGTCLLGESFWPPIVSTLAWLPALLACVESLAQRSRWRAWLGLVAATAMQALAGFPQFALYAFLLLGAYALTRSATLRGVGLPAARTLGAMAAAVALGLGVAGAQLVPTAELAALSSRSEGLDAAEMQYLGGSAGAAAALRNAIDPSPKLLAFDYQGGGNYLGIGTLLLLAAGAVLGPPALVWPLLALGALALALSDGFQGPGAPLFRLFVQLPGVGWFRSPERLRIVTLVAAIAVACIGLDRVGRGIAAASRLRVRTASAGVALTAAALALFGGPGAAVRALIGLAGIAAAWVAPQARARRIAQAGVAVCIVADLLLATAPYGSLRALPLAWSERFSLSGYAILDAGGLARLRTDADGGRVEVEKALPQTGGAALGDPDHLSCLEPLAPASWHRLLAELPLSRRDTLYDVAGVTRLVRPLRRDPSAGARLYAEFLARYVSGAPLAAGPPPGFEVRVLEREHALPRAYWIGRFALASQDAALEHVARGDFDFHAAVLLEADPGVAPAPDAAAPLRAARIARHTPESVEVAVEAPADGLLVLSDTWYPGWRASRDGRELEILRANGLFRAVAVPAGASRVVFDYRPRSFHAGLALSAVSLLVAGAVPLAARRR